MSSKASNSEDRALRKILEGTASHTGREFFRALVRNLAEALQTKGAWVTEYLPEERRLRAISFWMQDHFVDEYEYPVTGTPCERVLDKQQLFHVPENVIELFPGDPDLVPFGAVSYLGAPLVDHDGTILGHLAVQDTRPMPEEARKTALFRIFADRAASELRRLRAEQQLKEREEQLSRLFDSAMDAIIEIDTDLTIIQINAAARDLLETENGEQLANRSFESYLDSNSARKLKNLLKGLMKRNRGNRYLWVPGGFEIIGRGGEPIQTEATLSSYEHNKDEYLTLILRNVNARIEAEKRIDSLSAETEYLREEIRQIHNFDEIIGESDAIMEVIRAIGQVAGTDATVLISGETGTGKELVARSIHRRSRRRDKPLVKVNCAAIPESLIESEFFGHARGAFTGATEDRQGRFDLADHGTLLLDEIGELPLRLQSKLLRVLQEGEFEPVGSSETHKVDVRIIAATNRDLREMTEEGSFREDLYYRLNVYPIPVPPLRERDDDVVALARHFLNRFSQRDGRDPARLTPAEIRRLKSYRWPGNIRELRNIVERAVITGRDGSLNLPELQGASPDEVVGSLHPDTEPRVYTKEEMERMERENLVRALEASGWKVSGDGGAAALIGIPPSTFSSRMKSLGIERPR